MPDHVYVITEIVGTSSKGIDDAIQTGIKTAGKTLKHISWFEVDQIKGAVQDDEIAHYQVLMKLGSRHPSK
jgi:flavin-binding protein dodecin